MGSKYYDETIPAFCATTCRAPRQHLGLLRDPEAFGFTGDAAVAYDAQTARLVDAFRLHGVTTRVLTNVTQAMVDANNGGGNKRVYQRSALVDKAWTTELQQERQLLDHMCSPQRSLVWQDLHITDFATRELRCQEGAQGSTTVIQSEVVSGRVTPPEVRVHRIATDVRNDPADPTVANAHQWLTAATGELSDAGHGQSLDSTVKFAADGRRSSVRA